MCAACSFSFVMRTLFHSALLLLCVACAVPVSASTVYNRTFHAPALERDWAYTIYLPTGYHSDGPHLPVMYLLHGNNGEPTDWITQGHLQSTVDGLIERHEIPPVVIVMPQGGTDWYVDRKEKIETAFFDNLIPEIETHYAVEKERGGRAIGGVSMGGFGALHYAMTRPDHFCGVLLLSPAIYADEPPPASAARRVGVFGDRQFDLRVWHALNYPALWNAYMSKPWRLPMFVSSGDDDLTIQAEASALYTHLRLAGNPAALRIVDGGHTWDVWRSLLPAALKYTLACFR
jgi:enterochelin esterase-like enzyme